MANPRTIIIGLGETGISCANYFAAQHMPFSVIDSRVNPPKLTEFKIQHPTIPVYTGGFPTEILSKAERLIISPGIPKDHPDILKAISSGVEIIGDIELFARAVSVPVVAITGSNGKSTVTTLVGEMAKAAGRKVGVGGNLGKPALSLLSENSDLYVLELSSFQLETTYSLKPKVATILNLCPDHLDRYPSPAEYYAAKQRIYNHCERRVINRDDPVFSNNTQDLSFGLDTPKENHYGVIQHEKHLWLAKGTRRLFAASNLRVFGRHNIANILAALALGDCAGLSEDGMLSVLPTFAGLPHRCEWVREYKGVQWINDSKGTNVGATSSALQGLASDITGKWVLIAGGVGKNADFTPLRSLIAQYCRAVILIGESAKELQDLWGSVVPCVQATSMAEAISLAVHYAQNQDGVLLSPACASFDMFQNFEHRGDTFKQAVKELK